MTNEENIKGICFSLNEILIHSHSRVDNGSLSANIANILAEFYTKNITIKYSKDKFLLEIDKRIKPQINFKDYYILKCDIDDIANKVFIKFKIIN